MNGLRKKNAIEAVLFDMDGTVFDTERIYYRAWMSAAKAVGFAGDMDAVMQRIFGVSEHDIGIYFRKTYGSDFPFDRMQAIRAELIAEEIERNGVPLKEGVPEVFDAIASRGIVLALVSSAPRFRIDDFLRRTDLQSVFSHIVSGDRVAQSKPSPDIFLLAAREMGVPPSACLVAEDSHNGVLAARAAGMRVALIPDLQPPTDEILPYVTHLLPTLADLADCLDRLCDAAE